MECEVNGLKYVSALAYRRGSCRGCVAENNTRLCDDFPPGCANGYVWVEPKPNANLASRLETCADLLIAGDMRAVEASICAMRDAARALDVLPHDSAVGAR